MTETEYLQVVQGVPDPMTRGFLTYLEANNKVIYQNRYWLVVENIKYHTAENPHYTAFSKLKYRMNMNSLIEIMENLELDDWHLYLNAKADRTIPRFHVHLVRNIRNYLSNYFKY